MATRIIEYGGTGLLGKALPVYPYDQFIVAQPALTATGTSQQSAAVNSDTMLVTVDSDEAVYVHASANPTATTDCRRIQAGGVLDISIPANAGWKIAIRT